jgi:antitoxin StbD
MNAPVKIDPHTVTLVEPILADACVSISGLKKNPAAVIAAAKIQQVAILNRNRPVAYMISPEVWEYLTDLADDVKLADLAREELERDEEGIEVSLDDL